MNNCSIEISLLKLCQLVGQLSLSIPSKPCLGTPWTPLEEDYILTWGPVLKTSLEVCLTEIKQKNFFNTVRVHFGAVNKKAF
jgi:hypothetical protein